jgi:hypothetical protein|tara:strand:- start:181 stop:447 length:267 start_codon:yes stop_codon:yes gene_type:complete
MNLSDNDLELMFQLYDKAIAQIPEKSRADWAKDFIFILADYGIDLKHNAEEIADHNEYLDSALTEHFESDDEYDSDDEYAEEIWEDED